jgi:hypothetical protein
MLICETDCTLDKNGAPPHGLTCQRALRHILSNITNHVCVKCVIARRKALAFGGARADTRSINGLKKKADLGGKRVGAIVSLCHCG